MPLWILLITGFGIGSIAGVLSGLFGIGGGIIIVPLLTLLLRFSPSKSVGTSLAAMLLPAGIIATYKYFKAGEADLKVAGAIGLAMLVTSGLGATIGLSIGNAWISRGFGVLLVIVGVKFLFA